LPDVIVEAGAADLLDEDFVGEAQDVELLGRDLARAADRKAGTWERERIEMPRGIAVSGIESIGSDQFFCGGGNSGKVRAVRRPNRGSRVA
jgi:hypothetical protein